MKQISKYFFALMIAAVLAATVGVGATQAASIVSGSVIKGSSTAIYYLGADGKRYVFPNDKAYFSWYPDFSEVQKISDATLSSYPLGGNVTYRPGTQLVKIQSDPKVYAVLKGGVLRWVNSESAAIAIFGSNWSKQVDDIADAFFINYTVGSPIYSSSDYNPTTEAAADNSINTDLAFRTDQANSSQNASTGTANSAGTVTLSLSPNVTVLAAGQSTTLTANAYDTNGIANIIIYATANGSLVKTCTLSGNPAGGACTLNLYSNDYANGSSISIYAQMTDKSGSTATSVTSTLTAQNGNTTVGSGTVSVSFSPATTNLLSGQSTTVIASANNANGIASMGIYVNGSLSQTCPVANYPTSNTCTTTLYGSNYASGSTVSVYAQITDNYGNASTSSTSTLTDSGATGGNNSVSLSLSPYASTLAGGQSTNVTASGYEANGIASMSIYINGTLVQSCPASGYPTSDSCTTTIYGSNYVNYSTISVYAQAVDRNGGIFNSSTTNLSISASANGGVSVSLSLSPYAAALLNSQSTTATANASDANGIVSMGIYANGALVQSCPVSNQPTSATCAATIYGSNYSLGSNISVYAQTTDSYGNIATSSTSSISVQSGASNGSNSVSISFSTPSPSLLNGQPNGQSITATAYGYNANGIASMGIYANGALVQDCPVPGYPASNTCAATLYSSNYASGTNISVYAQTTDRNGNITVSTTTTPAI